MLLIHNDYSNEKDMLEKEILSKVKDLDPKPLSDSHMLEKDKWPNALRNKWIAPLKIDSKALNHKT